MSWSTLTADASRSEPSESRTRPPPPPVPTLNRVIALLEVLICSDFRRRWRSAERFGVRLRPYLHGRLSVAFVVGLSLVDTALLVGLILILLHAHGEQPRDVFLGRRPLMGEAWRAHRWC